MSAIAKAIVCEGYICDSDGYSVTPGVHSRGDLFDMDTGDVACARIFGGVRFDTVCATLVVGWSGLDKIGR